MRVESILASKLRRGDRILVQFRGEQHFALTIMRKPHMLYGKTWIVEVEWPNKYLGEYVLGEWGSYVLRIVE